MGILTAQSCDGDGGYDDTADEGGVLIIMLTKAGAMSDMVDILTAHVCDHDDDDDDDEEEEEEDDNDDDDDDDDEEEEDLGDGYDDGDGDDDDVGDGERC